MENIVMRVILIRVFSQATMIDILGVTEAFSSTAHKELSPAKNHINELGNVFFLEETFR